MKKQLQLVLLPTDKAENALIIKEGFILPYKKNYFTQEYLRSENLKSFHLYAISDEKPKAGDYFIELDLYGTRSSYSNKVYKCDIGVTDNFILSKEINFPFPENCRKVIITTDESLKIEGECKIRSGKMVEYYPTEKQLPTFTNNFINTYIERYNSGKVIKEIEVEYDCDHFQMPDKVIDILKVNTNNTVDVSLINDEVYTKEESYGVSKTKEPDYYMYQDSPLKELLK